MVGLCADLFDDDDLNGTVVPYRFVLTKAFIAEYQAGNPGKDGMLWLDILTEALNASAAEVISVGYDGIGDLMTLLLKTDLAGNRHLRES